MPKFKAGDKVKYDGRVCLVESVKEDGCYSLVTEDSKHSFDAQEDRLKELKHGRSNREPRQ